MAAPDFGLEALYKLQPIESTKNALCLLVHFVLTKHGWRYVGRGTEWKESKYWKNETLNDNTRWEQIFVLVLGSIHLPEIHIYVFTYW